MILTHLGGDAYTQADPARLIFFLPGCDGRYSSHVFLIFFLDVLQFAFKLFELDLCLTLDPCRLCWVTAGVLHLLARDPTSLKRAIGVGAEAKNCRQAHDDDKCHNHGVFDRLWPSSRRPLRGHASGPTCNGNPYKEGQKGR